jgi:hypothetical protein
MLLTIVSCKKKNNPNDATSAPSLNTVEVAFDSTQINTFEKYPKLKITKRGRTIIPQTSVSLHLV